VILKFSQNFSVYFSPRRLFHLIRAWSFYCLGVSFLHSQQDSEQTRSTVVTVISDSIIVDGVLDESIWQTAPKIGELIQRQPNPGTTPSERTEVILLRDADFLYVGIVAYDSEPDKLIGNDMSRDASLQNEDSIEILLDTFKDRQNAFYFATNPIGAFVDGLVFGAQEINTDWNAIWDIRTQKTNTGWSAEFQIPFKSLSFPENSSEWGFNIGRKVYRKLEEDMWSGGRLENEFLKVSEAGTLLDMTDLNQGIGLDVKPFLASSWLRTKNPDGGALDIEPGVDVFYNITPSLKLTGTINTDFGETEVDARQINLTRFSLFFPEKRSFFLEDVGVFNFASTGPKGPGGTPDAGVDVFPFFSRRIGLLNGNEVPLDAGLKLTGKVGNTDVGLLGVRTGETDFVDGKNFVVGRFKQKIFQESYVGGIFTDGNPNQGRSGSTYGADVRLATSDFFGQKKNFNFDAFFLNANNEIEADSDADGTGKSFGFSARYPNDQWDGMLVFREVGKHFDPGMGFVQRSNVRMYRAAASYNPRPKDFLNIQQMFHDIYYTYYERLDNGEKETAELHITPFDWHFNSGDSIHALADYTYLYERLFEPFEISPGIFLPVGEYKTHRSRFVIATAARRPLSGFLFFEYGDFWSGTSEQLNLRLSYNLPPHFTAQISVNKTFADLPQGKFIARIFTGTFNYALSPQITFSNLLQFDNRSRNLGWQSRLRWTPKPGNDLFISFNQGWINEPGSLRFNVSDSKVATKFQYTYRF
tara:strand:+ start:12731 stop:14998 length:2268 start_codon:yes stop_codon:yes gene_type:complete